MYLEHFNIQEYPFTITPNTHFYCDLPGHRAALNVLLVSLRSGEGFIKIVGEVGSGKTLLCRMLLDHLDDHYMTAYISNPDLSPDGLRKALAQELGISFPNDIDSHSLLNLLNKKLLTIHREGKQVVLLIDEAQVLPLESLEALRLLTNLETGSKKLLQVVLFGQPELDIHLNDPNYRQIKQRISFSYQLVPLSRRDLDTYLFHRLAIAGHTYGPLFTKRARYLLYKSSRGIPRLINMLCHKALMVAYGRGAGKVDHLAMQSAITETKGSVRSPWWRRFSVWWVAIVLGLGLGLLIHNVKFIF